MLTKFTHPRPGYYDQEGRFVSVNTPKVVTSKTHVATASDGLGNPFGLGGGGSGGGATGGGTGSISGGLSGTGGGVENVSNRYNPVRDRLDEGSVVEDWIPRDASGLDYMFRLMYHRDHIAGTVVDLLADSIWSDYTLVGIKDPAIMRIYEESLAALDINSIMPDLTREYLVLGRSISSLIYDSNAGIFCDLISHDPDMVRLTPIPIRGFDPKVDLIPSPALRAFIDSQDPRDEYARKALPSSYLDAVRSAVGGFSARSAPVGNSYAGGTGAAIPLDPINTLFTARRVFNYDTIGTSFYTRLITFWALEKALINASVTSARRRIRSILHAKVGIDGVWDPTPAEMDAIAQSIMQTEEDPVGGVVVTRTGVDMNELRDGASFYKWSDEWTMLTEGKLRALGANDALLCLAGDTLVPTKEHGLVRIDHFGQAGSEAELTTVGRTGADKTKKWLYSGKGEVVEVKTHHGTTLKCTQSHRILVLKGNDLIWKEAKDLNLGDVLCFNKVKCLRESVLPLDLIAPIRKKYANSLNEDIIKPEAMTPDLAYLVGLLVSEGCVGKYRIRISNTNLDILHGAKEKFIKIFGSTISVKIRTCSSVGKPDKVDKNGTIWRTVKDSYELCIWSLTIASYFEQLGLCTAPGRQSRNKEVPWSILQADESCQRAYLAAYVDGDGSVGKNGKHVVFYSFSKSILSQTQSLLAAHGIDSRVRSVSLSMTRGNALALSEAIAEYSLSGKFNKFLETEPSEVTTKGNFPDREYGIKTDGIRKVLKDRFVRQVVNEGAVFLNDDGEEVLVQRFGRITIERWKHLVYRSFEAGEYDAFLSAFEKISISEYKKVLTLFSRKFKYTRVTAVERLEGKTHVYDIQMQTDPSFVANCLVVHNSGDATYSNQEAARSFFMDRANMLRQTLTQKVFMRKIFPLLAQVHGFTKRSQAELDHNIRVSNKTVSSKYMVTAQSQENYLIPTINWHKDLVSQIDDQKIERLKSLEELGFPITLKQYSAAANIDLDDLLQDTENDALIRKKIAEWKESAIPEDAEDLAKQDFVKSLRNLSESNLRQVVSSTDKLGPLRSYLFWNEKGNLGPLAAEELIPVIAHFDPGTNAVYATVADGALKKTLREMLGHPIKAELAHYLLHSTGFTPIRPVLSKDAIEVVSEQIKSCLDRHSLHGNVYQLSQIAQKELKALAEYSEQYISERIAKWNSSAPKIAKRDRIPNNSKQLFSGV